MRTWFRTDRCDRAPVDSLRKLEWYLTKWSETNNRTLVAMSGEQTWSTNLHPVGDSQLPEITINMFPNSYVNDLAG